MEEVSVGRDRLRVGNPSVVQVGAAVNQGPAGRSPTLRQAGSHQELDHYAEVPSTISERVIADHQAKVGAGEKH